MGPGNGACGVFMVNDVYKTTIKISKLPKIDEIIEGFDYLPHTTQTRNLAYRVHYIKFLSKILENSIYGSLRSMIIFDIIGLMSNILEHILFIVLWEIKGEKPSYYDNSDKLWKLIDDAVQYGIIPKDEKNKIDFIKNKRNEMHPARQVDIHANINDKDYNKYKLAYRWLLHHIRVNMKGKMVSTKVLEDSCPYKELNAGEYCTWCLNYHPDIIDGYQTINF